MAVSLLQLSNGTCSLEFASADLPAVKAAIRSLYGKTQIFDWLISSTIRFGGEDFTFQNQWDDPCLIASAPAGVAMLRQLAEHLGGRTTAFS